MFLAESEISPQVIIVFVAMIYAGIKSILDKRKAAQESLDDLVGPEAYEADLEHEELIERQREELGLPPIRQVAKPPPLPVQGPMRPPLPPVVAVAQKPKPRTTALSAAEKMALKNFNSPIFKNDLQNDANVISTKSRLKQHLSSPTAAREALLLSEILGPPKSLK